jgi:hypothetical protein
MDTAGKPGNIGRREADRLLSGRSDETGRPELVRLLNAISGPALPEEVADESAAVALFSRQYELAHAQRARTRRIRRTAARLAAAFAVLLVGGLATGAEAGVLPAALQRPAHSLFSSLGVPEAPPSVTPNAGLTPAARGESRMPSPYSSASPYPSSFTGWCHAYRNGGKSLGRKELDELATAAGGTDKIDALCTAVLGAAASPSPSVSVKPSKVHGRPTPKPSHK